MLDRDRTCTSIYNSELGGKVRPAQSRVFVTHFLLPFARSIAAEAAAAVDRTKATVLAVGGGGRRGGRGGRICVCECMEKNVRLTAELGRNITVMSQSENVRERKEGRVPWSA